jgi:hypothetical protein
MKQYLYGASVQGIQSFIFKTNKLKEIIGASELVERICTTEFYKISNLNASSAELIQSAAGNVKCILTEAQCRLVVLNFPKNAQKIAPGITISQAVVEINDGQALPIDELEKRLKIQRNKISMPAEIGFMGLERDRRTGGVAYKDLLSFETYAKRAAIQSDPKMQDEYSIEALFEKMSGIGKVPNRNLSFDITDITASSNNSWIAIIHADANGLGNIIQNQGMTLTKNSEFKSFSDKIEKATKRAANIAFQEIVQTDVDKNQLSRYPIRPVVLGGDDLTVIIRADLALPFTELFLRSFENETKQEFQNLQTKIGSLTACAGIAYIKESYPLHYGINLAEALCSDAKKTSREESSIAFYKVQESFIEDLQTLKDRTLSVDDGYLSYYFGPYSFEKLKNLNKKLIDLKSVSNDKSKSVGKLRRIVSETYRNRTSAMFMMERMKQVNERIYSILELDKEKEILKIGGKSQLVDLITLHSFNYGNE